MKYLINEKIDFDSATGWLQLMGEENASLQLSRPSTLLLTELIVNAGKTSSRESLLTNVWEKNGLIPSSNNLSNHISYLRKTFRQLGVEDDVITTVPKEGFRLAMVTRCHDAVHINKNRVDADTKTVSPESEATEKPHQKASLSLNTVANISITVALILISISLLTVITLPTRSQVAMTPFPPIGLCLMYEMNAGNPSYQEEKKNRLKEVINRNNIDCNNKKSTNYFEFYHFNPEEKNEQKGLFFAQCVIGTLESEHCVNYLSVTIDKP
ncbi:MULTISPECIES: winged helix-turn-helix domain-containing protein [unclassified Erwinia]|uniref:winged helix-turn-helix domain-containing protein n=1 Tax=unclassified Erwinia TaxID=2622719 RepID=UPI0006FDC4F9|nr:MULTISPECIES: winged helix-turn-helix domain-containing protein [unclassified Erwinia]KQN53847.1 hypothetical protein ASF13_14160 [Erwinia sp. Leaf53]